MIPSGLTCSWGEERTYDGTTKKYWVRTPGRVWIWIHASCQNIPTGNNEYLTNIVNNCIPDCCQLLGQELGRARPVPYRPRGERVWDWDVRDRGVGPCHFGGHAKSPSSWSTQVEIPTRCERYLLQPPPWGHHPTTPSPSLISPPLTFTVSWRGEGPNKSFPWGRSIPNFLAISRFMAQNNFVRPPKKGFQPHSVKTLQ